MKQSSTFRRATEAFLREYGFQRVTAATAVATRTFETSDAYDIPIGGQAYDRTMPRHKAQNLNSRMWDAYKKNPIIWGSIELVVRATAGKQARIVHNKLSSENAAERTQAEKLQALYNKWWYAPANDWPDFTEKIQRERILFGEMVPIMLTNSLTGDVEVGVIDANCIKEIVHNKLNTRRVEAVRVQLDDGEERDLKIIQKYNGIPATEEKWFDTWRGANGQKMIGLNIGEVFYWSNNQTLSSQRGQGDFAQVMDPANDAVRVVRGIVDRIELNNRVFTEVVFPDTWDQKKVNTALTPGNPEYINPPRLDEDDGQPRIFGHSKAIEIKPYSASVGASEAVEVFKMSLALYSAGSSIPLHWMGWADELTFASAKDISNLPIQYMRDRQGALRKDLRDATDFQLDQWRIFGNGTFDGIDEEMIYDYDFELPVIDARSLEQIATTMRSEIDAVAAAKMNNALTEEQSADMIQNSLRKGGVSA